MEGRELNLGGRGTLREKVRGISMMMNSPKVVGLSLLNPGGNPRWRGGCWLWCKGSKSAARRAGR